MKGGSEPLGPSSRSMTTTLFIVLGAALALAGLWWLWGGRASWLPESRFHRAASMPTRVVVGLVHLILGYHLIAWEMKGEQRLLQVPRTAWVWLVLGSAGAVGGSIGLDRLERRGGDHPAKTDGETEA